MASVGLTMTSKKRWLRTLLFGAAMLAVPLLPFIVIGELPGERWLQSTHGSDMVVGGVGSALLALDVLLPIPSSIVGSLLGARLGFAVGVAFTLVGLLAGHVLGYTLGRAWPHRFAPSLERTATLWLVFVSRPVPVLAEAVAVGAGAAGMPFAPYVGACAAGNLIYAFALCATGAQFLPEERLVPALIFPMLLPVVTWALWKAFTRREKPI